MGQYTAEVASDELVKPEITKYFETFYATSDTPDGHDKYAASFTKDAKLIMASNAVQGRDGMSEQAERMALLPSNGQ